MTAPRDMKQYNPRNICLPFLYWCIKILRS